MRRPKAPITLEQNTWVRHEDYLIAFPEEGLWASGIKGEDPEETYATNLRRPERCIRPKGKATPYDLSASELWEEMLDSFLEIPKQPTIESKIQSIKQWLCSYGLPIEAHAGRLTLNEVYDAACSTVWLKVVNELSACELKHKAKLKRQFSQLSVIKDRSILTECALSRAEYKIYNYLFEKGTKNFSPKQAEDWQFMLHKIEAFSMENTWIYFLPDANWPGVFNWDRENKMHPHWIGAARLAAVYPKKDFNKENVHDLSYAAANYLRHALELILQGIMPSLKWRAVGASKEWAMVPSLRPVSPWEAMNYALYRRVINPLNQYRMCAYAPCGKMFKAMRSTKRFCSDLCRVKYNQEGKK